MRSLFENTFNKLESEYKNKLVSTSEEEDDDYEEKDDDYKKIITNGSCEI